MQWYSIGRIILGSIPSLCGVGYKYGVFNLAGLSLDVGYLKKLNKPT